MGAKFLKYGAALVVVYLVVANAGSASVGKEGFSGVANVVKAFQGR